MLSTQYSIHTRYSHLPYSTINNLRYLMCIIVFCAYFEGHFLRVVTCFPFSRVISTVPSGRYTCKGYKPLTQKCLSNRSICTSHKQDTRSTLYMQSNYAKLSMRRVQHSLSHSLQDCLFSQNTCSFPKRFMCSKTPTVGSCTPKLSLFCALEHPPLIHVLQSSYS